MADHTVLECTKHYSLDMYPNGQVKVNRKSANEQIIIRGPQGNVGLLSLPIPKMAMVNNQWVFENHDPKLFGAGADSVRLHNELLMEKDFLNRIMSLFFSQVM
jgi:hypothetical protein